jgi:hypothetical protein
MAGGPRHEAAHRRVSALAGALQGDIRAQTGLLGRGDTSTTGNMGLLLGKGLYGRWMALTLRHPVPGRRALLALGLGPPLHWTGLVSGLLVGAVFMLVPLLIAWVSPQAHSAQSMGTAMAAGAPLLMLFTMAAWPTALWSTRREQALLRLLPGVPQGSTLNRWLAGRLALQLMVAVALITVVSLVCIRRFDLDFQWAPVEDFVLGSAALSPFMLLAIWRDWSVLRPPTGAAPVWIMLAVLAMGGTAALWGGWLQAPWWSLAGLGALLMVPLVLSRWRLVTQSPVAWPVGWAAGRAQGPG